MTSDVVDEYHRLERASGDAMRVGKFEEYGRFQEEQKKLGRFRPWMTHSRTENAPSIVFHPQLLADFSTVDEFGRKMLEEHGPLTSSSRDAEHMSGRLLGHSFNL